MSKELKQWRSRMGMTQRDAAKALGITLQTYQDIENGLTLATGKPRELDRRTALAAAALEYDLNPIDHKNYKERKMKKFRNYAGNISLNNINVAVYETDETGENLLLIAERVATGAKVKGSDEVRITKEEYDALDSDHTNDLVRYKAAAALVGVKV